MGARVSEVFGSVETRFAEVCNTPPTDPSEVTDPSEPTDPFQPTDSSEETTPDDENQPPSSS